tara:strand:- start:2600 stop:3139 length:540 start_codon:yes stop_codon:yes gene_type:complete
MLGYVKDVKWRKHVIKRIKMKISKHSVVSFNFTLTHDDGTVLDSSDKGGPLVYLHGVGALIPGLEKELEGKGKGDKLQAKIAPSEAYGERNDQMIQTVPKNELPAEEEIKAGMQFQADTPNGPIVVTVVEVKDTEVTLDGNHPLAGVNLNFDVEVTDVRDATQEEIDHGHAHGPGGVEH